MAKFNFRQGIARRQEDGLGNPSFLQKNGDYMDLIVSPDPTLFVAAHKDTNYLLSENQTVTKAWGPIIDERVWLYWDVDLMTGEITRGITDIQPVFGPGEVSKPKKGQNWFDTSTTTMKVWSGNYWRDAVRVFAAEVYGGSTITHYPIGSQAGISGGNYFAGHILFHENKPVREWTRNNCGRFMTTETPFYSQFSPLANFRIESAINMAKATQDIPEGFCVAYSGTDDNMVKIASSSDPFHQSIGIASEDMVEGEVRSFITKGFVTNPDWDWDAPSGTRLFVGESGKLTTVIPTQNSIQEMGQVVSSNTVFVNPQPIKIFNRGSVRGGNYVPMYVDRMTGEEVLWDRSSIPGMQYTAGFVYQQPTPASTWDINHQGNTTNVTVQIYDEFNHVILPREIEIVDNDNIRVHFDDGGDPPEMASGKALLVLFTQP